MSKLSKLIKKHIEKKPKLKKTEKTVTKSRMFAQWLAENYPELRINSLEDNRGSNHVLGRAVDVAGIHNHKDKKKILKTALDIGLRVGKEVKGKKGVGGWTGAHYHFDENPELAGVHFTRGSETGNAVRKKRSKKENKENDKFVQEMNTLASKPKTIDVEEFTNKYKPRVKKYLKLLKGANSTSNLKELQKTIGTDPDGKFGKNTMRALINYVNKPEKAAPQSYEIKDIMGMDREEKMMSEENPSTAFSTNFDAKRRALQNKAQYSDMSFKDAFEQAMKDKGEGEIFDYKGKKILLKRAEPKKETKSFKDIISEYSSKEPEPVLEELEEPVELDYGGNELMDREKELEELLKKQAAYKDGGVRNKYELGGLGKDEEEEPKDPNIVSYLDSGSDNTTDPVTEKDTEDLAIDTPEINTEASLEELPEAKPLAMEKPEEAGFMDKLGSMFSSEEEPKKEQKPLTMKSLEERYNQLMEADAKERQTAGWATAAMHIASLIDKASAEPIGITPINFQAGDSRAQMKNLLAMGRAKGLGNMQGGQLDQLRYDLAKSRLEESKLDRKRKAAQFRDSLSRREREDLDNKVAKVGTNLTKEGLITRTRAMKNIEDFLQDEYKTNLDSKDAPDIGGVGVLGGFRPDFLTGSKDVSFRQEISGLANELLKARSGAAVTDQEYRRFLREVGSGNFSTEENLFSGLKKMREDIKAQTKNAAKVYGEDVFNLYLDRTGVDLYDVDNKSTNSQKKITDYTEEDIDNMSMEELKKAGLL